MSEMFGIWIWLNKEELKVDIFFFVDEMCVFGFKFMVEFDYVY